MKHFINQLIVVKSLESPSCFYSLFKEYKKQCYSTSESALIAFDIYKDFAIYKRADWKKAEKRYL